MSVDRNSNESHSRRIDKAVGAFLAFAVGDALGWPNERPRIRQSNNMSATFIAWTRKSGGRFNAFEEEIAPGTYSDDTQMLLSVARSLHIQDKLWWKYFTQIELPLWTLYERGGGGATKRAASSWTKGVPPWQVGRPLSKQYFEAGGNGVVMRILPHAIAKAFGNDFETLARDILSDGVATHGHPRALLGALLYAYVARWLLTVNTTVAYGEIIAIALEERECWTVLPTSGSKNTWLVAQAAILGENNYRRLWDTVAQEIIELLEIAKSGIDDGAVADDEVVLNRLGCFGREKGSGTVSAVASIYLASRYAASPKHGVIRAANCHGADTDTLAALTGGLLGLIGGTEWLPSEWAKVQDYGYLKSMASSLSTNLTRKPIREESVTQKKLDQVVEALEAGDSEIDLPQMGVARVETQLLPTMLTQSSVARCWQVRTEAGQTWQITKIRKVHKSITDFPAESKAKAAARVQRLEIFVPNIPEARSFYVGILGLEVVSESANRVDFENLVVSRASKEQKLSTGLVIHLLVPGISEFSKMLAAMRIGVLERSQTFIELEDPTGNRVRISE